MKTKKILFTGLGDSTENEIRNLLDKEKYIPLFIEPSDAAELASKEPVSLIAIGDLSLQKNIKVLQTLKKISSEKNIPFITIISGGREKSYIKAHSENISSLITAPVMKKDFFNFLEMYMENPPSEDSGKKNSGISPFAGSLILNLLAQNRIVKTLIKKRDYTSGNQGPGETRHVHNRGVEKQLWEALDGNLFRLYYQPVINMATGKLTGFESLIRIEDPEKGVITPDKFISIAENSAIIFPLGLWIIDEACRQIACWKEKFHLDTPVRININLSPRQFIHPQLTSHIFEIIDRHGIDHDDIGFELTESAFMEDMESANIALLELRSRKFSLYMDDFGTGYSSLSYLMHFPVDIIKIDQSFVKWMHIDEQSETLVRSIVSLGHNLGLKVVAEGVDDESHVDILKECGCDYGQGYLFSKPLPADRAEEFILQHFNVKKA